MNFEFELNIEPEVIVPKKVLNVFESDEEED